jgi:hypothetical protein
LKMGLLMLGMPLGRKHLPLGWQKMFYCST